MSILNPTAADPIIPASLPDIEGGFQGTEWSAEGDCSLHVPDNSSVLINTITPATVRIIARHANQQVSVKTGTRKAQNLFTNPQLKPDNQWVQMGKNLFPGIFPSGNYATVAENLFPGIKGDGTYAEVRRNVAQRPQPSLGWGSSWGGTKSVETTGGPPVLDSWAKGTATAAGQGATWWSRGATGVSSDPIKPSTLYYASIWATSSVSAVAAVRAYYYTSAGASAGIEQFVSGTALVPNEWVELSGSFTTPADAAYVLLETSMNGTNVQIGSWRGVSAIYLSETPGKYFDGSTTPETAVGVVQPEDFRVRWLGAENASESVMEIETCKDLVGSNCIAGHSTRNGKPAVRLISTGSSPNGTTITVPTPVGASLVTGIGTVSLDAPLQGPLWAGRLTLGVGANIVSAPNLAGDHPLRLGTAPLSGGNQYISLTHGGEKGSGDVWWTDIGLYAGVWEGENFYGDDDPSVTGLAQPEDFRIRWTGVPYESTSVLEIEIVAGLTATNCVAGVSTRDGRPAVRLIPTAAGSSTSYVAIAIPSVARSGGTMLGTAHLDAALTGGLSSAARRMRVVAPDQSSDEPANAAGSYAQRLTYSALSSTYSARWYHGGSQGSGDVWWTDVGLFAGEYDGPSFSGEMNLYQYPERFPDADKWRITWDGTPNESPCNLQRLNTRATVAENLFPGITGDGTYSTVAENLFKNPRLVGDGTYAEVRRNHFKQPSPKTTAFWYPARMDTAFIPDAAGDYVEGTVSSTGSAYFSMMEPASRVAATPGDVWTYSVEAWSETREFYLRIYWLTSSGSVLGQTQSSMVTAATPGTRVSVTGTAPEGTAFVGTYLLLNGSVIGDKLAARNLIAEKSTVEGPYFDGSTPDFSVDPDMRQRWLGAENASESVMEIERVAGLTAVRGVAGVSTWEGKPAARLIPTDDSGNGAYFTLIGTRPIEGTFTSTVNLKAPLTNIGNPNNGRRVYATAPDQFGPQAPNEAGSFESRVHYSSTATPALVANNGNRRGGGDVWWTDIGLFAGTYTGNAFSGDDDPAVTGFDQPEDFRIRWSGAVDNSTSVMESQNVTNISGGMLSGDNTLRVEPGDTATVPVAAPSTAVVVAKNAGQTLLGDSGVEVRRNRALKPRATQVHGAYWTFIAGTGGVVETSTVPSLGEVDQPFVRAVWTTSNSGGVARARPAHGTLSGIPVVAGESVSFSLAVVCSVRYRLTMDWVDAVGSWLSQTNSGYREPTSLSEPIVDGFTTTVPAGAVRLEISITPESYASMPTGATIAMGALMVGHGDYFDGSTPPSEDGIAAWAVTPNDSESIMYAANVATSVEPGETIRVRAESEAAMLEGYWDSVGIYAGTWEGENFYGDDDPSVTGLAQPEDFTVRWKGQPYNSPSVLEIERVRGFIGWDAIAGVSTFGGKPAVRQINTSATDAGYLQLSTGSSGLPLASRPDPGTLLATINLAEPVNLVGNYDNRLQMYVVSPLVRSNIAPNEAGSHPVRLEYAGGVVYVFNSGAGIGPDVWWTDIGLFAGEYDGEAFSGSTAHTPTDFYFWDGTPDNSTSSRYEAVPVDPNSAFGVLDYFALFPGDWDLLTVMRDNISPVPFSGDTPGTYFHEAELSLKYPNAITSGAEVDVDVKNFLATSGSSRVSARLEHEGSDFWYTLSPGSNKVVYTGTGKAIIKYRPAYI